MREVLNEGVCPVLELGGYFLGWRMGYLVEGRERSPLYHGLNDDGPEAGLSIIF